VVGYPEQVRKVNPMFKNMTRSRLAQVWVTAVALIAVASVAFGMTMTMGTAVVLLAASLVPLAVILLMWPREQPLTASEMMHGANRRDRA
jgi:nucleoside permease NupC